MVRDVRECGLAPWRGWAQLRGPVSGVRIGRQPST